MVLGRHGRLRRVVRRPAAVFLMAPGSLGARLVQQALPDVAPDGVRTVQPDCVDLLDLDGPAAPSAPNPQQMLGNLAQLLQASGRARARAVAVGRGILQECAPVFWGQVIAGSQTGRPKRVPAHGTGHFLNQGSGRHAPTGGTVGHLVNRTYHEHKSRVENRPASSGCDRARFGVPACRCSRPEWELRC